MATAERMYGLSSLCTICVGGACVDTNTLTLQASGLSSYNQAVVSMLEQIGLSYSRLIQHIQANCKFRFGVAKRSDTRPLPSIFERQDPAAGSEVFSLVENSGSGNISIDEYIQFVHYKYPEVKESKLLLQDWVEYFYK